MPKMPKINALDMQHLHINDGPVARQLMISRIEKEFKEGNIESSIFYQVCSLYGIVQDRYFNNVNTKNQAAINSKSHSQSKRNNNDPLDNELLQYIKKALANNDNEKEDYVGDFVNSCNFLQNTQDPKIGHRKIIEICKSFPREWTIVQVCKGPRPQTTHSVFHEIHKREADIYVTILKHARNFEYPDPICIRFSDILQIAIFERFSQISNQCKEYMQVDPKEVTTHDAKFKYWENLKILDKNVRDSIDELRAYVFPWLFVFRGVPSANTCNGSLKYRKEAFEEVDQLCDNFNLKERERVLLSLAALQSPHLSFLEMEALSEELSDQQEAQLAIQTLLQKLQTNLVVKSPNAKNEKKPDKSYKHVSFPCILVVDEQIDHFFWEELNVTQEMCRFNSLHCLNKLYNSYQHRISKGYLQVNLKRGACVINPDGTLLKTARRMGAFFKYWTPNWPVKLNEKPTQEELLNDFFKRDCYVYAGHGSGLQHISGKRIIKKNIEAVVFLFGCDSTRMTSNGLYSDLNGTHFYYHAAMCPSLIGTILPALDAKMDEISVEIVSRCIIPESKDIVMWHEVDSKLWIKEGIIKQQATEDKSNKGHKKNESYQIPSLCGAVIRVHTRGEEKNFYNTVPYVYRGLPAWNCDLQPLPVSIFE